CLAETPKLWKSDQHNNTFFAQMWQTILSGQMWRGEVRNKKKDGTLYDVQLTISPIPGPGELPRGFVGVQSDITPLKEMDRIKSEFLSTAAHELRTPLTSIQGFSEILLTRTNLKDEQKKRYQTFINQQANALAAIINDLLDLTRLESGQGFEMTITTVDLKEIINEVLFGFRENNPKHTYNVVEQETWPAIIGDPVKLAQLFKNLYSNATKYSPDGGDIILATNVQEEYNLLHITITDQGLGMTKEQLSRIFERFYRADASNTAIGGTGLGMAISQLIVNQHQGKIWIESELHVGTTIHLLFPLQDRPQYILVIEDDAELMEMEKTILEHEGFTAMTAYEGHSGLELARSGSPNLILLDLNLPGMTGFDILDRLKENYLTENIPVIITSAMDTPEFIESAIDKGATDYLVKPYSIGDLLVRINRALTKSTNNQNEQVRVIA
ncbi:MAG: ATP-binding protein, partial [Anaerolineae bacterium]|nr:ATP-binding protein [Anaerolineae bacterium]